jgi:hypothetical protein
MHKLFNAALGGMGQCGIIVKAVIPLVAAPTHVRFFRPQLLGRASSHRRHDGFGKRRSFRSPRWTQHPAQGRGVHLQPRVRSIFQRSERAGRCATAEWLTAGIPNCQHHELVDYYRRGRPLPRAPRPWLYLCLPASRYVEYAKRVFSTPEEFAYSGPCFSVWRRAGIRRPLTPLPDENVVVKFQCSRSPPASADMPAILAMNQPCTSGHAIWAGRGSPQPQFRFRSVTGYTPSDPRGHRSGTRRPGSIQRAC